MRKYGGYLHLERDVTLAKNNCQQNENYYVRTQTTVK